MSKLKEGLIYATVNGLTGFSIYTGAALFYGDNIQPAIVAGIGVGMLAFGSYLVRETDGVNFNLEETLPAKPQDKAVDRAKRFGAWFTPRSIRRHGLFHFLY